MSSTIDEVFARCREERRPAFIAFLMAGDPDLERTPALIEAVVEGGADIVELGVPFSDPIADGPVNQRAATRALEAGTHLSDVLRMVARHRDRLGVPIVLFTYFNPILARGVVPFAEQAAASGVDGVLCLDVPPEEAEEELVPVLAEHGLDSIFLLAPTSPKARMDAVGALSSGFVYYVSRTGVTGVRAELPPGLKKEVKRVRKRVGLPVAVGFGVSTAEQVAAIGKMAEGVVVGSALVQLVEDHAADPDLPERLQARVRELTSRLGRRWHRA